MCYIYVVSVKHLYYFSIYTRLELRRRQGDGSDLNFTN